MHNILSTKGTKIEKPMDAKLSLSSGTQSLPSIFSSGSRSSQISAASNISKNEDFTKDNVASPMDLECAIETERLLKIIDEAIDKVKLVISLPLLFRDKTLRAVLDPQHYVDVVFIYEQYEFRSSSSMDVAAIEDLKAGDLSLKNRINPELEYLIYTLNSYPALKPVVEEMVDKTKPMQPEFKYLLLMERFRDLLKRQLECTAEDYLAEEFRTRKVEHSNANLIAKIEEYKALIRTEMECFEELIASKNNTLIKLKEDGDMIKLIANARLEKKILDSDRQMVLQSRSHEVRYEMLKEDAEQCRNNYDRTLKMDLADEKKQRAKKFKLETQLMSWLQKYDLEMGEKQVELDELNEKYEEELKLSQILEEKLAEQDKEFIPLMAERDKEYHQELSQKEMLFRKEHAARVIQVAWRVVLANRKIKKKLIKELKKMREMEAAAEAKAQRMKRSSVKVKVKV